MSLQRGCVVVERNPGQWYCAVAMEEYDDEFEDYVVYGPKPTSDAAFEAMHERESNPGGFNVISHDKVTPEMAKFIDVGRKADARPGW